MINFIARFPAVVFATVLIVGSAASDAQETKSPITWTGLSSENTAIALPAESKRPTVVLFVMPAQPRTHEVFEQLTPVLRAMDNVHVLVVVSGEKARDGAARLKAEESCPWPIVLDHDYRLSALLDVHAWPTTVLVSGGGEVLAHIAGLPKHCAKNLDTHLAFACGKIDRAEFENRISDPELIVDDPRSMASRHLQVAQRLLDKGLVEAARVEVEKSLRLNPDSPALQLATVRALLALGDVKRAAELFDGIDTTSLSPLEVNLLRGRVLAGQGKDSEGILVLQKATRLNPNPAEAWYELGLAYERQREWTKAAEAFRKAFEATDVGRRLRPLPK